MMISRPVPVAALLLIALGACGCATNEGAGKPPAHDNLDAVLWLQASTEYAAVTEGIYAAASATLRERIQADPGAAVDLAVVLDVDETVLDNSRYQAQLVLDDATYGSETWDRWIALRAAAGVPGAVEFIRTSQSLGVHVALVTNRTCRQRPGMTASCPQKDDTLADLERLGVDTASVSLFLRGDSPPPRCRAMLTGAEQDDGRWSSDKTSRRACVSVDREIVMLFGDQLGDFTEAPRSASAGSGRRLAADYDEFWGKTWFMLPNPTYGDWRPNAAAEKRKTISGVD